MVDVPDVITPFKFGDRDFGLAEGQILLAELAED